MKYSIALQINSSFQLLLYMRNRRWLLFPFFTLIPGRSVKIESRQLPLSNLA